MNVDEHEAVLAEERSIAGDGVIVKRHAVHSSCDGGVVDAVDLGCCEKKRRALLEHIRHARKHRSVITPWKVSVSGLPTSTNLFRFCGHNGVE